MDPSFPGFGATRAFTVWAASALPLRHVDCDTLGPMDISQDAVELIIAWEVAGGDYPAARRQYEARYHRPSWPGNEASGLTIGIGYDLRHQGAHFEGDWKARLRALPARNAYERLAAWINRGGSTAAERNTSDISIPWEDAISVYRVRTLPRYIQMTREAFPGVDTMHPHVFGALTSLIYNCGPGTKNKPAKQRAYAAIREAVDRQDVPGVAAGIREVKKHHAGHPLERGLNRRRESEANLVMRAAYEAGAIAQPNVSVG